jgi:hypothetical protein
MLAFRHDGTLLCFNQKSKAAFAKINKEQSKSPLQLFGDVQQA